MKKVFVLFICLFCVNFIFAQENYPFEFEGTYIPLSFYEKILETSSYSQSIKETKGIKFPMCINLFGFSNKNIIYFQEEKKMIKNEKNIAIEALDDDALDAVAGGAAIITGEATTLNSMKLSGEATNLNAMKLSGEATTLNAMNLSGEATTLNSMNVTSDATKLNSAKVVKP